MTRAQSKVVDAWCGLIVAHGGRSPNTLGRWLRARWGTDDLSALTGAQARHASRQLNAWRAGMEGRPAAVRKQREDFDRWKAKQARRKAAST